MNVLRGLIVIIITMAVANGCSSAPKHKPRVPLSVKSTVSQEVAQHNLQGIQAFQGKQLMEAKTHFQQAVAGAPDSAEAHYNLGLTLFALGENDQAREQFIEAANLAPGDKVIWDSPALRQYGSPDSNIPKQVKDRPYSNRRPTFGGGPR